MVYHHQKIYVYSYSKEGPINEEPMFIAKNTIQALDMLWKEIGNDEKIEDNVKFYFKYFNEGHSVSFRNSSWDKAGVKQEIELNKKENDLDDANLFKPDGKWILNVRLTNNIVKQHELTIYEVKEAFSKVVRRNLAIRQVIQSDKKHFLGESYVTFKSTITKPENAIDIIETDMVDKVLDSIVEE